MIEGGNTTLIMGSMFSGGSPLAWILRNVTPENSSQFNHVD
jgi:hypothetical protein